MATTYSQIETYLTDAGLRYEMDTEHNCIVTGHATEHYENDNGRKGLVVIIQLLEDGKYFRIFAPMAYRYKDGPNKLAVMQALAMVQWRTKLIQFEYDDRDGEIRPVIEFPLEDAPLGKEQFFRTFAGLVQLVDEYDPVIRNAMNSGEIVFDDRPSGPLAALLRALGDVTTDELGELLDEIRKRRSSGGGPAGPDEL